MNLTADPATSLGHALLIPGDVNGILNLDDMSYIGSYYGIWQVRNIGKKTMTVHYTVLNTMDLKSVFYGVPGANSLQAVWRVIVRLYGEDELKDAFKPKRQNWVFKEELDCITGDRVTN